MCCELEVVIQEKLEKECGKNLATQKQLKPSDNSDVQDQVSV